MSGPRKCVDCLGPCWAERCRPCYFVHREAVRVPKRGRVELHGVAYFQNSDGYYLTGPNNGVDRLYHRQLWIDAHGPIPPGWQVHHLDHDKTNNDLSNLAAMSARAHHRHHHVGKTVAQAFIEFQRERMTRAHREMVPKVHTCVICESTFERRAYRASFCSDECRRKKQAIKSQKWRDSHRKAA